VKLVAADTLFRRAHQVHSLKPLMQWDMAGLENRANANRELLPAVAALLEARTLDTRGVFLARLRTDALQLIDAILAAAVRTDWTFSPN
jgi:hypothetical protein